MNVMITHSCDYCNTKFERPRKQSWKYLVGESNNVFCSRLCSQKHQLSKISVQCSNCRTPLKKKPSQAKRSKSGNHFCSKSCSAIYNNAHKSVGTRVSKLEKWLQQELLTLYPNLIFKFNSKEEINSELDIYIPEYNLAFELNGIFHYEPIYGQDKLESIQNNDQRKFQACFESNIELCIIDTSGQKYFKPKNSKKFLDIITNIIDSKS